MKRFGFFLVVIIFITNVIFAQTEEPEQSSYDNRSLGLGVQAGFTTGTGISYKKTISQNFSMSAAITPPFIQDSRILYSSFGLTGYFNLKNAKHSRFFTYLSMAVFYWQDAYCSSTTCYKIDDNLINTGIGLGMELLSFLSQNISIQAMLGYGIYTESNTSPFSMPTIELGLYYYLK